jgi:uncharacterized membrane protein
MDEIAIVRALHVVAIVLWIGGVGFVTTALLPSVRHVKAPEKRLAFFDAVERRFASQARITTLLAGLTGFYMVMRLDLWSRFLLPSYWWMHAMVIVWFMFTAMLFILEPLILHRWLRRKAESDPEATFRLVENLHRILLSLSILAVFGAVAGSHGFMLFG